MLYREEGPGKWGMTDKLQNRGEGPQDHFVGEIQKRAHKTNVAKGDYVLGSRHVQMRTSQRIKDAPHGQGQQTIPGAHRAILQSTNDAIAIGGSPVKQNLNQRQTEDKQERHDST